MPGRRAERARSAVPWAHSARAPAVRLRATPTATTTRGVGVVGRSGSKLLDPVTRKLVEKRRNDSLTTRFDSVSTHFVRPRLAHPVRPISTHVESLTHEMRRSPRLARPANVVCRA
eukprot:4162125-Prymnesium_polylepis.1